MRSPPVGSSSGSGAVQPVASSRARAVGSVLNRHGLNSRTWAQSSMDAATLSPASSTTKSRPRLARWAAAAMPTGPAPMTATGSWADGALIGVVPFQSCLEVSRIHRRTVLSNEESLSRRQAAMNDRISLLRLSSAAAGAELVIASCLASEPQQLPDTCASAGVPQHGLVGAGTAMVDVVAVRAAAAARPQAGSDRLGQMCSHV